MLHRLPALLASFTFVVAMPAEISLAQGGSQAGGPAGAASPPSAQPGAPAAGTGAADQGAGDEATVPYETEFRPTGSSEVDSAISSISALKRLQGVAPTSAEGLVARALQEQGLVTRALRAEGFYGGRPVVLIDGQPPETPQLAARLAGRKEPVKVAVGAEPGERFRIGLLRVAPEDPGRDLAAGEITGLAKGDPARAEDVISAGDRLVTSLRDAGYPFASIPRREVTVDFDTHLMEVVYHLQPGPQARFATPEVEGATRVSPRMLNAVAGQLTDREYSPQTLSRVRRDLVDLGVFGMVRAQEGTALDGSGRLPVTFLVSERPRRALGVTGAYETRNGPTATVYWEHRNLFGGAERLRLEGSVGRTSQSSSGNSFNARVGANLRSPWIFGRNMTLVIDTAAIRERLLAYDRDAVTGAVSVETKPDPRLTLAGGVIGEFGKTKEYGASKRDYQLVGLLGTAFWDDTDSLLDPSRGLRLNGLVSPIYAINGGQTFVRMRGTASAYHDLTSDKGTILAGRISVGSILGTSSYFDVPPHMRFYAGGGGSVRGYDFQRIGPRRSNDTPTGGLSVVEASLEVRQRIAGAWGMAAFVDGGSVQEDSAPGFSNLAFGAGLGVRYATAIGPIRADVAFPLKKLPGDSGYGLYIGIGQAF
ncbi:Outer membrane protein [Roseomonas mucosa]|uniref:Outer membrane protein assembly factor YaeT n=1 Tax=Roseomonas mucosa TaxID=207340 RepID=A0A1S8D743_9PROT|nr:MULTISPECIES: autotransporter assembly complex family protein [Roseomonas]MCG7351167.1 autotransporter assembly complex protein TamA [Roseomonas mucosa]MCG7355426.1 autotransporter assembly complex protein TamA [Roseomonas mucosa]MDT8288133.1 autotransporter assembly complex family protein [Roseomonas mucosa]MDT8293575.1 autotransporter assembly complex family protein [Roseomonas mucosa]MDT8313457.1 autotransporter assembly complex family protein [Roseomonas mucosa]